ncbi:hypothetical protein F511_08671 [Dorcoceras hygrometricum]|uniref:Helicase domain-containing family protein n=1 Tax=Dorcoceras hygrometricum TaxID=472368 RepID=A0A2Z7ABX5_9LAMI|nr:hypothetical protein F511_08671 [Dorcoceras hygrometricum]
MSLFDLQDVCIAIGSIATLDLPMVVDLIGIYGLKGPYCTLTTTNWFLQALSVIPRGSWGDVARRSYHDPLAQCVEHTKRILGVRLPKKSTEADEGVSFLVVDRIGDIYRSLPRRADVIVTTVGARHKCQQGAHWFISQRPHPSYVRRHTGSSAIVLNLPMVTIYYF